MYAMHSGQCTVTETIWKVIVQICISVVCMYELNMKLSDGNSLQIALFSIETVNVVSGDSIEYSAICKLKSQ